MVSDIFIEYDEKQMFELIKNLFNLEFLDDIRKVFNEIFINEDFNKIFKIDDIEYFYSFISRYGYDNLFRLRFIVKKDYIKNKHNINNYSSKEKEFIKKVKDIMKNYKCKISFEKISFISSIEDDCPIFDEELLLIIKCKLSLRKFIEIFDLRNLSKNINFSYKISSSEEDGSFKFRVYHMIIDNEKLIKIEVIKEGFYNYNFELEYKNDELYSIINDEDNYNKYIIHYKNDLKIFNYINNEKNINIKLDISDINYSEEKLYKIVKEILLNLFTYKNKKYSVINIIKKYFNDCFNNIETILIL